MNEHGYIRSVHRQLPPDFYRWKINDAYAGGVADSFYSGNCGLLFAEYKYINDKKIPKKDSTIITPDLSPLQLKWLKDRYHEFEGIENAEIVVILGTPLGGIIFTHLAWEEGISRGLVPEYARSQKEIARAILEHCTARNHNVSENYPYNYVSRPSERETSKSHIH